MELKISAIAKKYIKNNLDQLQGMGGLLINFVEYKSCCGAFIQISNATIVDIKKYANKVVPIASEDGITAYIENDSDFFETNYNIIRVEINHNKDYDLFKVQFE
ncbi:MAG: hypothetical protein ACUVXA_06815 [Candidatus Jordarchaeum sp.]|uniref:hypothetical protein n=1 Tax=Candidatus Jordarchaeum sp. TaxID=2823881 RepID=UPI00404B6AA9